MKTRISEFLNQLTALDECMEFIKEAHRRAVEFDAMKYKIAIIKPLEASFWIIKGSLKRSFGYK